MKWGAQRRSKSFVARRGAALLAKRVSYWGVRMQPIVTFSKAEVRAATDDYRHQISDGLSKIFEGRLAGGPAVAVKVPRRMAMGDPAGLINEFAVLSGISHRNVVRLLGCCLETEIPLLVTELATGGTLYQRLVLSQRGVRPLRWTDRVRIAGEVADALNYLHTFPAMPIVHRDVNTENVLLDEQGTAKITCFTFSLHTHPDGKEIQLGHLFTPGTFDYGDPDYIETGILNEKFDVYSFGVLLLTLLVGREPRSVRHEYGSGLVEWFTPYMLKGQLSAVLEPSILQGGRMEDILSFAEVALRCAHRRGEDRPTMKDVVCDIWQINCTNH